MVRVGLTGGIACGKTTVAKMLEGMGARLVYADTVAHQLYAPGAPVYVEVVKQFGPEIVQQNGQIDRAKLGAIAFGQGRIEELNRIVHPAVVRSQEQWMNEITAREPQAVVIVEAALIYEAGVAGRFSKVIVVTCQPDQKVTRYAQRTGIGEPAALVEVERRSRAQLPDAEKVRRGDYVIDNSSTLERTREQTARIYSELKVLAISRQ
ncbi:MAG TPA: dephospho-CoA kinase [Candidatus Saccharimonadales bacterium]|jgi:dephospho-CoA kinase|nr:dephospho-CoA kinase [Candidatus Saccharimonadales bacterium]